MEGPTEAEPGDVLTYLLTYEVKGVPGTDATIIWSDDRIQYVSSRLVAGSGQMASEPTEQGVVYQFEFDGFVSGC